MTLLVRHQEGHLACQSAPPPGIRTGIWPVRVLLCQSVQVALETVSVVVLTVVNPLESRGNYSATSNKVSWYTGR